MARLPKSPRWAAVAVAAVLVVLLVAWIATSRHGSSAAQAATDGARWVSAELETGTCRSPGTPASDDTGMPVAWCRLRSTIQAQGADLLHGSASSLRRVGLRSVRGSDLAGSDCGVDVHGNPVPAGKTEPACVDFVLQRHGRFFGDLAVYLRRHESAWSVAGVIYVHGWHSRFCRTAGTASSAARRRFYGGWCAVTAA